MDNKIFLASRQAYRELVDLAQGTLSSDADTALAFAGAAAGTAWRRHPGFFADRSLERMITELTPRRETRTWTRSQEICSVLHVLTQAYPVGGHTRLASRWIDLDKDRGHSVVLTRQQGRPVPPALRTAVASRGGKVFHLDRTPGRLSFRAALLRQLAERFDAVVLHTHPDDVVPVLSFGGFQSCPVVFLNHADHVFWLGSTSADVYVSIRETGRALCVERRAIPEDRTAVLPIPIPPVEAPPMSRVEAKERLGLPAKSVLMLTVASAYKFTPTTNPDYLSLHLEALARNPKLNLIAVGPSPDNQAWKDAENRTRGRLRAVRPTSQLELFWAAADLYTDSFPFGSLTSLLEAGSLGIPMLSFDPFSGSAAVLRPDDLALSPTYLAMASAEEYLDVLGSLVDDPTARVRLGGDYRDAIRDVHCGPRWRADLEDTYKLALSLEGRTMPEEPVSPPFTSAGTLDMALAAIQGEHHKLLQSEPFLDGHASLLGFVRRFRNLLTLRGGFRRRWVAFLPDWSLYFIRPAVELLVRVSRGRSVGARVRG